MSSRTIALALLVVIPGAAFAQGKAGGRTESKASSMPALPKTTIRYPSVRDIEDHNPASLLVDKRKKLALTDSSVTQLKALEKTIKDRNAQTVAMYDSLRRKVSMITQDDSTATLGVQVENQRNRTGLRNLFGVLQDRRKQDAEEALALVPEASKKAAADLLKNQGEDFDRLMPLEPRGGRPPGYR